MARIDSSSVLSIPRKQGNSDETLADLFVKTLSLPNGYEGSEFNEVPAKKVHPQVHPSLTSARSFPPRYERVRDQTSVDFSKGKRNEWRV